MNFWQTVSASLIAGGLTGGLAGAIVRYFLDARKQRYEYLMRLHDTWWTSEFHKMRSPVYDLVLDYNEGPGEKSRKFLEQYAAGDVFAHSAGYAFVRILFFFADLNARLDKKLVDKYFAYRLFGESQYFWFKPLIDAAREIVGNKPSVRWIWETQALDKKFGTIKAKDDKRQSRTLTK